MMNFKNIKILALSILSIGFLSACSETQYAAHVVKQLPIPGESQTIGHFKVGSAYKIKGRRYYPRETYNFTETGTASWYGPNFHGKPTANGETFDKHELTAAHRTLQLPSIVRVTNLGNGRSAILRVNDRGPFAHERILDVSERAATILGFKNAGVAKIRLEVIGDASKQVASMAKQKIDTRGFEVALNNKTPRTNYAPAQPAIKPEPITQVAMSTPAQQYPPQNITPEGQPMPLRKPLPVQSEELPPAIAQNVSKSEMITGSNVSNLSTGKIYVQAGSFSQEQNALMYSNRLSSYGNSKVYLTRVDDRPYFRVRLGPYTDRIEAQQTLAALNLNGNKNAVIVVD